MCARVTQVIRPATVKPNRVKPGCYGLLFFVAVQPFMYGQARDVVRSIAAERLRYHHPPVRPPARSPLCPIISPNPSRPRPHTLPFQPTLTSHLLPARHRPGMCSRRLMQDFMCRSITLAGGLLLLIWSENDKQRRNENVGLPQDTQSLLTCHSWPHALHPHTVTATAELSFRAGQGADRLQLCGRFFLTFIFFFQVPHALCLGPFLLHARQPCASIPAQAIYDEHGGLHKAFTKPSFLGICASLLLLVLSGLVCAGFKTEW